MQLTAAFRLRHDLDDAFPESVQKQREWTLQIVALSESAIAALEKQDRGFSAARGAEVAAPVRLSTVRESIHSAAARLPAAAATLKELHNTYDPALTGSLTTVIEDATTQLDEATAVVDAAQAAVSPSGVNAVTDRLSEAEASLRRATLRLDAVDARAAELVDAASALTDLVASTKRDLVEARGQRDAAPGPNEALAIGAAITVVEDSLAARTPRNPIDSLERIGTAVSRLDSALASARSQKERIEHATIALGGTIATVTAQLSEVRAFITVGGRRVGADARTRLAEAERELAAANAPGADPVEALDAARRAVTHVRDADALARYDAQR
jgi:chromosome segregation ATPase